MNIKDWKESTTIIEEKYINFHFEYFTRDSFYSFAHADKCKRIVYLLPKVKGEQVKVDKDGNTIIYLQCRKVSKSTYMKKLEFIGRYPAGMDVVFVYEDKHYKLTDCGEGINESFTYRVEEI